MWAAGPGEVHASLATLHSVRQKGGKVKGIPVTGVVFFWRDYEWSISGERVMTTPKSTPIYQTGKQVIDWKLFS